LAVEGRLSYGALTPLKYDIMGPFSLVPFMECRHSVWSMQHSVFGRIMLNGESYEFEHALGYWEGDRGYSFPKKYAWTHCFFQGGSLMLSVAEIPVPGFSFTGKSISFTGVIGIVWWRGKEFRFATYLGARVVENAEGRLRVVQKGMELEVRLLETGGYPLKAPELGNMVRTIHESASCRAFYRLRIHGKSVFAFETERASFEYEYS
ncbi:MAG: tocopherol cyclase family protein, partial [Bariatricus sp.]